MSAFLFLSKYCKAKQKETRRNETNVPEPLVLTAAKIITVHPIVCLISLTGCTGEGERGPPYAVQVRAGEEQGSRSNPLDGYQHVPLFPWDQAASHLGGEGGTPCYCEGLFLYPLSPHACGFPVYSAFFFSAAYKYHCRYLML